MERAAEKSVLFVLDPAPAGTGEPTVNIFSQLHVFRV